jgi:hypothetical protein
VPKQGTSQIVYSPHDYGPSVYAQEWFNKDFTEKTLLDDYWYDTWAYINAEDIGPELIGEWGGHMDGAENQKWMTLLRDYMIKHHINHTFWCLNTNSGDTGGLWDGLQFGAGSGTTIKWNEPKYELFEKALWQTSTTGKYIGLDHKVALGKNGLSLDDFYANYASTEGSNLDGGTITPGGTGHEVVTKPTTKVSGTAGPSSVTLKWTAASGAQMYRVCKYVDGSWQKVTETTDTSYTINNLKAGTNYKFAVVIKSANEWNLDYSNAITITPKESVIVTPDLPKITKVDYSESTHQFKLTWSAVKGAQKYGIATYQNGKWKVQAQLSSGVTSFTSPKMKAGQKYTLVVCAKIDGEWDTRSLKSRSVTVTIK